MPARPGRRLIAALAAGSSVALVSDAGTPLVSDPGYRLVEQALAAGIRVVPIPGAVGGAGGADRVRPAVRRLPVRRLPAGEGRPAADPARRAEGRAGDADLLRIAAPARRHAGGDGRRARRPAGGDRARTDQDLRGDAAGHAGRARGALCRGRRRRRARSSSASARRPRRRRPTPDDVDRLLLSLAAEMPASKAAAEAARHDRRPQAGALPPAAWSSRPMRTGDPADAAEGLPARPSRRMAGRRSR